MASLDYIFRPIDKWPRAFTNGRRPAPFRAGYAKTLIDLERELRHLGVTQCVIQAACSEDDIRLDGRIRSSARLQHPGIIVAFTPKGGAPLQFPCDTYSDWTDNLRAVTLALAALRAVDRYGVTRHAEQYRGWKALPEGGGIQAAEWANVEAAAIDLCRFAGHTPPYSARPLIHDPDALTRVYRQASQRWHPDKQDGDAVVMAKVNRARDFIEQHSRPAA